MSKPLPLVAPLSIAAIFAHDEPSAFI